MNENLTKALHGIDFVVSDLQTIYRDSSPIMALESFRLLQQATELRNNISRLVDAWKAESMDKQNID